MSSLFLLRNRRLFCLWVVYFRRRRWSFVFAWVSSHIARRLSIGIVLFIVIQFRAVISFGRVKLFSLSHLCSCNKLKWYSHWFFYGQLFFVWSRVLAWRDRLPPGEYFYLRVLVFQLWREGECFSRGHELAENDITNNSMVLNNNISTVSNVRKDLKILFLQISIFWKPHSLSMVEKAGTEQW